MPVVLRVNGYKFFFYQADLENEPPHVHVAKDGNEANSGWTRSGMRVKAGFEKRVARY